MLEKTARCISPCIKNIVRARPTHTPPVDASHIKIVYHNSRKLQDASHPAICIKNIVRTQPSPTLSVIYDPPVFYKDCVSQLLEESIPEWQWQKRLYFGNKQKMV